jgi:tripartite-type tricarboxylate transporter receptor subunit TctC
MRNQRSSFSAAAAVAAIALFAAACSGGESAAPTPPPADPAAEAPADGEFTYVDGVLQPLADGFPNGPLTIIVEDDPGSSDSIYASAVQERLRSISPVPINIEHRGDFGNLGTWEAVNFLNNQEAAVDGRIMLIATAPGFVVDALVVDMEAEIGLTLDDINPLMATERLLYPLHASIDAAPFTTMQEMLDYCEANPGTIRYISGGPGSGQDVTFNWYMDKFGCEVETIIGGGAGDRARAVAAGEGWVTLSRPDDVLPLFDDGKVRVLMVQGDTPVAQWGDGVATSADMGIADDPFPTYRMLLLATDVPATHEAWLYELILKAVDDDTFRTNRAAIAPGLQPVTISGDDLKAILQRLYDEMLPVLQRQGVYFGG